MNNYLVANISLLYSNKPMLERFSAAAEHGFTAVEIQFPYEWSISDLRNAADTAGVGVHLINVPAADLLQGGKGLSCHPENINAFRSACNTAMQYALGLDAMKVNILAGNLNETDNKALCVQTYVDNIRYAAELFMAEGVMVTFEAINNIDMPNYLYSQFSEMYSIFQQVNHANASMQYDIYHMAMMGEPIALQLQEFANNIGHIQFADMPGRGAPGTGSLSIGEYFQIIDRSVYQGAVAAEYKTSGDDLVDYTWLNIT
ncbi:hydroxypyruvate isomerase [Oceanospirillum multiglobuliferum]|uniref:Xylose isomerase-like TIM barrel domain-containing protein n=1 Tax=Oceanospirillum multiglobuliferum TaxID=64969 RepID=A0A1T4SQ04_9GAMM|nr:TIM barrel protein [Oceanospirillum multiglobuliferum]OPX54107.1 hypothetical protein BTE48_15960 [Oceanospirillum multiglobuliferum]SKA29951.1 hydroxypyruvate isomerase [Oceanospirillum multiglobuliferum]